MGGTHINLYKKYVKNLGVRYGLKEVGMILTAHLYRGSKIYSIKSTKTGEGRIYLRTNTSDPQLVNAFLLDDGEYDFLWDEKYKGFIKEGRFFIDAGANIGLFSRMILCANSEMGGPCGAR